METTMLQSLSITNFRCFPKYHMPGLARVNLLVGKNNSGKTALLEGLQLLTTNGDPGVIREAAIRRGEVVRGELKYDYDGDVSHVFPGHLIKSGMVVSLLDESQDRFVRLSYSPSGGGMIVRHDEKGKDDLLGTAGALVIESSSKIGHPEKYPISNEGLLVRRRSSRPGLFGDHSVAPKTIFIPSNSLRVEDLSRYWDSLVEEGTEDSAFESMALLEPKLVDIVFMSAAGTDYIDRLERGHVYVRLKGGKGRLPLGSFGEGMWRLLAIAISANWCSSGCLLIDEIDSGLHHSLMPDVWKLVVSTAIQRNVQVFATTHSHDCLKGLATLCDDEPEFAKEVAVHQVSKDFPDSVPITGYDLVKSFEHHIEIRA